MTRRTFTRPFFTSLLALVAAASAVGCQTTSSTSTGPSPVKCQVSLQAPTSIDAGGGKDSIAVATQAECAWTVSSSTSWISGLTPSAGQGSGHVEFQAAANPAGTMRSGDIAVNEQHVQVQQRPAPCRYEITPPNQTIGAAGGTVNLSVTSLVGCAWQVSTEANWIAINGTSGNGSGNVSLLIAPNGAAARSASVFIAGQTFTLAQSSLIANAPNCAFSLDRPAQGVGAAGGSVTVSLTAPAGCSWTAVSAATWITVVSGATGTGPGAVAMTVAANAGAARTGTLTIAGQTFTVNQAAAAPNCSFSISPGSQSIGAGGGNGTNITVSTSAGCSWTANSNASWITLTSPANASGPGTATFTVGPNSGAARSGSLTIAGQTFTVNQASGCSYSIDPRQQSIGEEGGQGGPVAVSTGAGCAWTATSHESWITITSGASGSGNGTVLFNVANNDGKRRSGRLTIAGETFTVDQANH